MQANEKLTILDDKEDHWWKARNATGQEGYVPSNYVRKLGIESEMYGFFGLIFG